MTHGNEYGDLLPEWKITLINQCALARGIPPEDLAEVQQELILAVLGYQHDSSLGATEHTALNVVIDRQITLLQRSHARRLKRHERFCERNDITGEQPLDRSRIPDQGLRMDVATCMQRLPETEREICAALAVDEPRVAIARRLGLTRYEVDRIVERVRACFIAWGLQEWVRG